MVTMVTTHTCRRHRQHVTQLAMAFTEQTISLQYEGIYWSRIPTF